MTVVSIFIMHALRMRPDKFTHAANCSRQCGRQYQRREARNSSESPPHLAYETPSLNCRWDDGPIPTSLTSLTSLTISSLHQICPPSRVLRSLLREMIYLLAGLGTCPPPTSARR